MEEAGKKNENRLKEMKREIEDMRKTKKDPDLEKFREIKEEIEELKKTKKEANIDKMRKEIEELKTMRNETKFEKCDLVLKRDLEEVRKEIVNRGVEEIRKEKQVEDKKMGDIRARVEEMEKERRKLNIMIFNLKDCLLYTSPSPRDKRQSRMPSSA